MEHKKSLSGLAGIMACATGILSYPCALFAGDASYGVYVTRGFAEEGNSTTATGIYATDGDTTMFSDRLIQAAVNTIDQLDAKGYCDINTGARLDSSLPPDVSSTSGDIYLHVGYINSGFVGSGQTVDPLRLNGDLTVGRIAFENSYTRDGTTYENTNVVNKISAVDEYGNKTDYKLIIDYTGASDSFFYRAANYGSTFQFDSDILINSSGCTSGQIFTISSGNNLIIGSKEFKRTLTVGEGARYSTGTARLTLQAEGGSTTVYSDVYIKGKLYYGYCGWGELNLIGDTYIDADTLSCLVSLDYNKNYENVASLVQTGNVTVTNYLTSASSFRLYTLNGPNQTARIDGNIYFNGVEGSRNAIILCTGASAVGTKTVINGDVVMNNISNKNTYMIYMNPSGGHTVDYNGTITFTNAHTNTPYMMGLLSSDSTINYNGRIDASTYDKEVGFGYVSGATNIAVNFTGSAQNELMYLSLRGGPIAYNFMKSDVSSDKAGTVISVMLGLADRANVNLFGENQLDLSRSVINLLTAASDKSSGTINLNGTSLYIEGFQAGAVDRHMTIDFGMTDSGMSAERIESLGLADQINATGAGIEQVFSVNLISVTDVAGNYIEFKNFVVGEDKILCANKLSELGLYSQTTLDDNVIRISEYMDSEKYGVDYWLTEELYVDDEGMSWYSYSIIPEPSVFAALLGAISLGFAALGAKRRSTK